MGQLLGSTTMNRPRLESESFSEYKTNLKLENKALKQTKRGVFIWDSVKNGTYCKSDFEN